MGSYRSTILWKHQSSIRPVRSVPILGRQADFIFGFPGKRLERGELGNDTPQEALKVRQEKLQSSLPELFGRPLRAIDIASYSLTGGAKPSAGMPDRSHIPKALEHPTRLRVSPPKVKPRRSSVSRHREKFHRALLKIRGNSMYAAHLQRAYLRTARRDGLCQCG